MTKVISSSKRTASVLLRHRALKWAAAIGLHAGLIGLLLYASLGHHEAKTATHSITVTLLPAAQDTQPPTSSSPAARAPASSIEETPPNRPLPAREKNSMQPATQTAISPPPPRQTLPAQSQAGAVPAASPSSAKPSPATSRNAETASAAQVAPSGPDAPAVSADCPYRPSPTYPDSAAGYQEKGDVQLSISITEKGVIDGVDIRKSSGFPALDDAARMTVLKQWHCVPAKRNGKDVAARVGVMVQFVSK